MRPIGEVVVPPELTPLQAQLAMAAVIAEMGNPQGLRLDEPVDDPVSQYKHDLRLELSGHPQTIETQLAAREVMVETYIVPPAETEEYVPPPPPIPVLASIEPSSGETNDPAQLTLTATGLHFLDGDSILFNGATQDTTFVSETELTCIIPPSAVAAVAQVKVSGVSGFSEELPFTYTDPIIPERRP